MMPGQERRGKAVVSCRVLWRRRSRFLDRRRGGRDRACACSACTGCPAGALMQERPVVVRHLGVLAQSDFRGRTGIEPAQRWWSL